MPVMLALDNSSDAAALSGTDDAKEHEGVRDAGRELTLDLTEMCA